MKCLHKNELLAHKNTDSKKFTLTEKPKAFSNRIAYKYVTR